MITKTWVVLVLMAATVAACGLAGVHLYRTGYEKGVAEVQAKWDEREKDIAIATTEQLARARAREKALARQIDWLTERHREQVDRITRNYHAAVERLRQRPEARAGAGGVPEGAAPDVGCTGEGLSRSDSEFLVWLGAEAARTQAALQQCVAQYNQVREQINGSTQD